MGDLLALAAAVVAAVIGLVGVVIGAKAQRRISEEAARRDEAAQSRAVLERYQEPLVRAAYDLQSRLFNMLTLGVLESHRGEPARWRYARDSTAWLFGQYFGWVEIVRREAQFLALPEKDDQQRLQLALGRIASVCSSDRFVGDPLFRIPRSNQRALGEIMVTAAGQDARGTPRTDCLGFAAFSEQLGDPASTLAKWFAGILDDVDSLADIRGHSERLLLLQHSLIDLVDLIDPERVRFPEHRDRVGTGT